MDRPRWRFTVRRMLAAVAAAALLLYLYRSLPSLAELIADGPFNAVATVRKSWDLGSTPAITVDIFEGSIYVLPGQDGLVHAEMTTLGQTKLSPTASQAALDSIELSFDHRGDTLRIVARGASGPPTFDRPRKEAYLTLHVPDGVHLDLRTGRGIIRIGESWKNNVTVHCPISAFSIRARNDSKYRIGYAEGDITVETTPPPGIGGASPAPTRLQLDAAGRIEIRADNAIVEARAWHGDPPGSWTPANYEDGFEGSILFEGTLAEGSHSFRSAHRTEIVVQAGAGLRVDAEAVGGAIGGDLLASPVGPVGGRAMWRGSWVMLPGRTSGSGPTKARFA